MLGEIVINLIFIIGILMFMCSVTWWTIDMPVNNDKEEEV